MHIEKRFPGELRLCHRQWTKNPAETTGKSYKNVNLVTRTQKWMGSVGCFGQIENIKRQSLISVCCGVGLDVQLYIVIAASVICVWGTYAFMRYQISHQTELLHHMTGYSIRTHLGRTQWWKNITSWLDKPGDYSELEMDATTNISQCVEDHIKGINSEINYKEYDRKLILEYLKGKAEVHVDDIIANSGADKLRVYPILFEEVMDGFIVVVKENKYGSPIIVSLKGE